MSEIDKNPKKTLAFDPEKCNSVLNKVIETFQEHKPTIGEILVIYGNLGYTLGAAMEGYESKGPNIEELKKIYEQHKQNASDPTAGEALMLQGILTTNWFQDHEEELNKERQ
tara:strand:+ start:223 stop:558 length:336 start_codon:yes stop_codon:yes gene_type:complete